MRARRVITQPNRQGDGQVQGVNEEKGIERLADISLESRKAKSRFDQQHVRWTGYLTITNNERLRYLLAQEQIPSLTRFVNEAITVHLESKFGFSNDKEE